MTLRSRRSASYQFHIVFFQNGIIEDQNEFGVRAADEPAIP